MKGLITKSLALLCAGSSLIGMVGCETYRHLVDPCYPERYAYESRQSVQAVLGAQVNNGHVLEQTVWNYHFEAGTDKLTPGGQQHLAYLARRRPTPDPKLFLQTAYDLSYDPAKADKFVTDRTDLDNKRMQSMQKYLNVQTAGRPMTFEVAVHDPSTVGMAATPVQQVIQRHYTNFQGAMGPSGGVSGSSSSSSSSGSTSGSSSSGSSSSSR